MVYNIMIPFSSLKLKPKNQISMQTYHNTKGTNGCSSFLINMQCNRHPFFLKKCSRSQIISFHGLEFCGFLKSMQCHTMRGGKIIFLSGSYNLYIILSNIIRFLLLSNGLLLFPLQLCATSGSSLGYGFSRATSKSKSFTSDDENQTVDGTLAI